MPSCTARPKTSSSNKGTRRSGTDQLSAWYLRLGRFFDIGTLYVTVAGLLNMLVVLDVYDVAVGRK